MNRRIWDLYAPIYELVMRSDEKVYKKMYRRIRDVIRNKDVLEIAVGPGSLAKNVAPMARSMIATDYSPGMIAHAKKGCYTGNLKFEVADATGLPYWDDTFDVVIAANVLHLMPEPEMALREIARVLKKDGVFIAPNFVDHDRGVLSKIWSFILKLFGIRFRHQWSEKAYKDFLIKNGWKIRGCRLVKARVPIAYVECRACS